MRSESVAVAADAPAELLSLRPAVIVGGVTIIIASEIVDVPPLVEDVFEISAASPPIVVVPLNVEPAAAAAAAANAERTFS